MMSHRHVFRSINLSYSSRKHCIQCVIAPYRHSRRFSSSEVMGEWNYLVSPAQLAKGLKDSNSSSHQSRIVPLCGAWFLPNDKEGRTGLETFKNARVPSAVFFDIDEIKDHKSPYPHMLPSTEHFEQSMRKLGINNEDVIVVYDSKELGIFSAPRVAWTLKVFGHKNVHILNNFRLWVEGSFPLETEEPTTPVPTSYTVQADFREKRSVGFEFVKEVAERREEAMIVDARPNGRFTGADPEPRPGLSSGHMPNSISLPFSDVLDSKSKAFLPPAELKALLTTKKIDGGGLVVSSCGTGVSAAVIDTAFSVAGIDESKRVIYDGSWTEWAQRVSQDEGLIVKD